MLLLHPKLTTILDKKMEKCGNWYHFRFYKSQLALRSFFQLHLESEFELLFRQGVWFEVRLHFSVGIFLWLQLELIGAFGLLSIQFHEIQNLTVLCHVLLLH